MYEFVQAVRETIVLEHKATKRSNDSNRTATILASWGRCFWRGMRNLLEKEDTP